MNNNIAGLTISNIEQGSPADQAGLMPGDSVHKINGGAICDVIDVHYHASEAQITVEYIRAGIKLSATLVRDYGQNWGFDFQDELSDGIRRCVNQCVFCFIHQMPKGLRKSLYLMDDDFRLSFLHGNYVTLTNMDDNEFNRVIEQSLSPIYVSVHATDPGLRGYLLGKPKQAPILPQLKRLADNGIEVHAQIVLCPGLNDGVALERTLTELFQLEPSQSGLSGGVVSVAIVPVGLSRFRSKLYPLKSVASDYSAQMINKIKNKSNEYKRICGRRFVYLSDEWFFLAQKKVPSAAYYEGFPQYEDGVGACRFFLDNAKKVKKLLPKALQTPRRLLLITGKISEPILQEFAILLNAVEGLRADVLAVENRFFGERITVTGLLTAQDILDQIENESKQYDSVCLPSICLRDNHLFIDSATIDNVRESIPNLIVVPILPIDFCREMHLT